MQKANRTLFRRIMKTLRNSNWILWTVPIIMLIVFFLGAKTGFTNETIMLRYSDPSKSDTSRTKAVADTFAEIERLTGGRVKHQPYWAQSLLKIKDTLRGLQSNTVDVAVAHVMLYHKHLTPLWGFSNLLFELGTDVYGHTKALNELYYTNKELKKELDQLGVQFLSAGSVTATRIAIKEPVKKVDDFKGLRIRATGPVAKLVLAVGGIPISVPIYEAVEGLSRGVLDGTQAYLYWVHAYKIHEYTKYIILDEIGHLSVDYWITKDALEKMSPDIQMIYLDAWRNYYPIRLAKHVSEQHKTILKDFNEAGVELYYLRPEDVSRMKELAKPINNKEYFEKMEKKGIDGNSFIEQYKVLYEKYKSE
jgi:TRAP-type C4-dicarboxylate transport system substrate-binding protein